jgi:hypothetical protein
MAHNTTLGQTVIYVSSKGHQKVATVVATPESFTGSDKAEEFALSADQVNLLVVSPFGRTSARLNVPTQESVKDNVDFAQGGYFLPLDA